MNIAILGYGKMGRIIHELAVARGHSIISIDPHAEDADAKELSPEIIKECSCAIHFTAPEALKDTATQCIEGGCNLVVGTTGWYDERDFYEALVQKHNTGFLFSPNFSLGVNAFFKIVQEAAHIFNRLEDYDVAGVEYHHNQKQDSPSGTAHALTDIILQSIERKSIPHFSHFDRAPRPDEFHFASVRCGTIQGTHTISFDSSADTISLQHTARSRSGFALGAIQAAEWLEGKKGFYSMDAFMQHILGSLVKGS